YFFSLLLSTAPPPHRLLHSFPTRRSSDLADDLHLLLELHAEVHRVQVERDLAGLHPGQVEQLLRQAQHPLRLLVEDRGRAQLLRSEEHTSELQSRGHLVCRLLLEKKKNKF